MKNSYFRNKELLEKQIDKYIKDKENLSKNRKRHWKENSHSELFQNPIDFIPRKFLKISNTVFETKNERKELRREISMWSRKDILYLLSLILLILVLVGFISFVIYISVILLGVHHPENETFLENIYRQKINETNQNATFQYLTDLRNNTEGEVEPLLYTVEDYSKRKGKEEDFYNRQEIERKKREIENQTQNITKIPTEKPQTEKEVEEFYEFFDGREELRKQTEYKHYLNYMDDYIPRPGEFKPKQLTLEEKILIQGGQRKLEGWNPYNQTYWDTFNKGENPKGKVN